MISIFYLSLIAYIAGSAVSSQAELCQRSINYFESNDLAVQINKKSSETLKKYNIKLR